MFLFVVVVFVLNNKPNAKVISSVLNLRELALIKQQHCYTIIYVDMAQRLSRLLLLCRGSWILLITQMYLMQSNYFVARCELKNVQVWWSVIWEFTVKADSLPPNMLFTVDTWGQLLCLTSGNVNEVAAKFVEWGQSRCSAWHLICFHYFFYLNIIFRSTSFTQLYLAWN